MLLRLARFFSSMLSQFLKKLVALHEQCKQQRKAKSREEKVAEEKRLFELKQQKKKEKHRGR